MRRIHRGPIEWRYRTPTYGDSRTARTTIPWLRVAGMAAWVLVTRPYRPLTRTGNPRHDHRAFATVRGPLADCRPHVQSIDGTADGATATLLVRLRAGGEHQSLRCRALSRRQLTTLSPLPSVLLRRDACDSHARDHRISDLLSNVVSAFARDLDTCDAKVRVLPVTENADLLVALTVARLSVISR